MIRTDDYRKMLRKIVAAACFETYVVWEEDDEFQDTTEALFELHVQDDPDRRGDRKLIHFGYIEFLETQMINVVNKRISHRDNPGDSNIKSGKDIVCSTTFSDPKLVDKLREAVAKMRIDEFGEYFYEGDEF